MELPEAMPEISDLLGCPRKLGSMVSKRVITYNLLINGGGILGCRL